LADFLLIFVPNQLLMKKLVLLLAVAAFLLPSCVTKKKYKELQSNYSKVQYDCEEQNRKLRDDLSRSTTSLADEKIKSRDLASELDAAIKRKQDLEDQLAFMKATNTSLLDRLSDLSVVSKAGAESIKRSLEAIDDQNKYIRDLTTAAQRKDSLNLALVMTLKRSLADVNDTDVTIEVKKGVVYISISDKLLFRTASADISTKAETVLGKIAKVLNDHKDFEILVEGHTDNVPIKTACMDDNWDLSVKRATSIVRFLQTKHSIAPERMTAGGRGEYVPKASNQTVDGRALNRRTEIIILPKLDQFFQLLEEGATKKN
jgi:chemotaxis protein MotB